MNNRSLSLSKIRIHIPSIIISAVCLVFLFLEYRDANFFYNCHMSAHAVLKNAQIHRLLTYMFSHSGIEHLLSNMILLFAMSRVNMHLQSVPKFYVVYLSSGMLGGLIECLIRLSTGTGGIIVVGASGAVMGIVGSTLALLVLRRKYLIKSQMVQYSVWLAIIAAVNLVPREYGVDYLGHACGFIVGIITTIILFYMIDGSGYDPIWE